MGKLITAKSVLGLFETWTIDHYTAERTEHGQPTRIVWICNGFSSFKDYPQGAAITPTLDGLSRRERKVIWRELQRELHNRAASDLPRIATAAT